MTVKRWPMRLPNDDRILDVIGTTYDIAARRFKRAFGVEPIGECWKEREMKQELDDGTLEAEETQCWDCEEHDDGGNNLCIFCEHNVCFDCQAKDRHNCGEEGTRRWRHHDATPPLEQP